MELTWKQGSGKEIKLWFRELIEKTLYKEKIIKKNQTNRTRKIV